ncbi:polysaccharide biosynthesis protein [Arsukibacterium ikkense]|uniref:Polysaccharide biosynthesis protein n=2 Tax=Arsukibacterium ikkense TaxID=336831 RepID=A0A0M2VD77_9GAMM|nr:polysaccharide biosynthesis protein [Arsukibacterium ikkense]
MVLLTATASTLQQQPAGPSQAVRGGTGLLQTPTARMATDGNLSINYSDNEEYRFWSVSIQLFPWLESTVRYTDVRTRLYSDSPGFSGDQTLKDKGIDVKFRLREESRYLPQVAVGFLDFGGTGFFESEFIALSKQWGPLDFHLGMGWGYLGSAGNTINPFCEFRDSFCNRPWGFSGAGGKIDYQRFFKGQASLFGGVEYQTPWQPLRLKLEYEGNDYSRDRAGDLQQDSRWNIGAVYNWGNFDFNLNYQRGNTVGFGVNYALNMHSIRQIKIEQPPRAVSAEPNLFEFNEVDRAKLVQDLFHEAGFLVRRSKITDDEITLYGNQLAYRDYEVANERMGRILASVLPATIKRYRIINFAGQLPMVETVIDAEQFVAVASYQGFEHDLRSSYVRSDVSSDTLTNYTPDKISGFGTGMETFWIQTFGNPEAFYLYQAGVIATAGYQFNRTTALQGAAKITLLENFNQFNFKVDALDTPLPRVRTFVREYVTRSKVQLENLFGHWQDRLAPNVYGQVYGGYLETMYGGLGGELLYRPVDSNLAYGFDINYVQQRSYENDFDFFDYKVLTGHANIYWQPEFLDNTLLTFNIGRFLAKDVGVNVDFAKRFDSGIVVGAYAAVTNASSADYGEGSFTKGFYVSIPFDLFSLKPAIGRGKLPWVPISRDGGQPLNRPSMLYNTTEQRSPFQD